MARADQTPGIRPRASLGRQLDIAARNAFPASCTILLMLLTQIPFGFADQAALLPAVTLACVYFWSLYRPDGMPPPVVFLIGVLLDLLGYLPLGVGALTLLVVHGLVLRWRGVLSQLGIPVGVAGVLGTCRRRVVAGLDVGGNFGGTLAAAGPAIFEAALTAALYPALAIVFVGAHRGIADPDRV